MKVLFSNITVLLFLLFVSNSIKSQKVDNTNNFQLDQIKQLQGVFQTTINKDTVEIWESQSFGEAFIINVSQKIDGKINPLYKNNIGFSSKDGKLNGFILYSDATFFHWTGSFLSDKKLHYVVFFGEFDVARIARKYDIEFINSDEWILTSVDRRFSPINLRFVRVK